ncbi:hypothetical protein H5410_030187, partial [Solanum commersonii]
MTKRWPFCRGSLLTHFLHSLGIDEEVHDVFLPRKSHLVGQLVDVTKTRAQDMSHGIFLSTRDCQLRIGGCPITMEERTIFVK